jgi:hypothetical protein
LLFKKFLQAISQSVSPGVLSGKEISELNPDKIYIENVRSILGVSSASAERICETAVRQGVFRRGIEVVCPDGSVVASADTEAELPPVVSCWSEIDGHLEEEKLPTEKLKKTTFYRLNDRSDSVPYGQTA